MPKSNDISYEEKHEHHRYHIKENIKSVSDGPMDRLSESLPKILQTILLSSRYVDQGKIFGDELLQEKSSEI